MSNPSLPVEPPLAGPSEPTTAQEETAFQTDQVFTIAGAHFIHDSYSAFIAPLLPLLQERLNIGYTLAGGLAIYAQLPSLLNPFIGYLADKVSLRYFIILAPAITGTLMSCMGLTSSYFALAILMFAAGLSIAAFHAPAPAMIGRISGDRVGTGMSIFMASGELGRTVGPLVVIGGVSWFGLEGIWRLAIVGWLVSVILYIRLRHISARPVNRGPSVASELWARFLRVFSVLVWIMAARIFIMAALTTYLPTFMSDVGQSSLWLAAASLTILEAAGVVGALATGTLSDRLGRAQVLFVLLGMSPLLLLAFLYGPTWSTVPLLIALGFTALSPTPVLLAIVQDQFPDNRALANGIYLGLNFVVRAFGIWVVGLLADQYGLVSAFLWSGLIAFMSLPAVFFLPNKKSVGG